MKSKVANALIFIVPIFICLGLYWPVLHGLPIWDDKTFLFQSAVMKPTFSYWTIFKSFNWPVSVIAQKYLFSIFGENFLVYHALNLLIHVLNSILLFICAKRLKLPYAPWLYWLFMLHPSNVISVGWMIQFKTLICFTFAILSYYLLLRAEGRPKLILASLLLFVLSILSKSASLPFALILLGHYLLKNRKNFKLLLLPLLLISTIASYRLLSSPTTRNATPSLSLEKVEQLQGKEVLPLGQQISNVLGISYYYFWQVFLPIHNGPVKGLRYDQFSMIQFGHIFFISLLFFTLGHNLSNKFLFCGYLMLLPFMGIIFAPFMNITWVSDQHLYLVIPFFLCFALELMYKAPWRFIQWLPIIFLTFFIFKTLETVPHYKDEITFFESSLKTDPYNVPIAHNLVISYLENKQLNKAINLAETFVHMAEASPEIRSNPYFPDLFILNLRLHQTQQEKK